MRLRAHPVFTLHDVVWKRMRRRRRISDGVRGVPSVVGYQRVGRSQLAAAAASTASRDLLKRAMPLRPSFLRARHHSGASQKTRTTGSC